MITPIEYVHEVRSDLARDFSPVVCNFMKRVKDKIGQRPVGFRVGTLPRVYVPFNDHIAREAIPGNCEMCLVSRGCELTNHFPHVDTKKTRVLIARFDSQTGELWAEQYELPGHVQKLIERFDSDPERLLASLPASVHLTPVGVSRFLVNKNRRKTQRDKDISAGRHRPRRGARGNTRRRYRAPRQSVKATSAW